MGVVGRGAVGVSANTSALDIITTITMMIILMMIMKIAMIAIAIRMVITSVDGVCWSGHDCSVGRVFGGPEMFWGFDYERYFISMKIYIT